MHFQTLHLRSINWSKDKVNSIKTLLISWNYFLMRRAKNAIARTLAISPNLDDAHRCLAHGNILYQACHEKTIKLRATILAQFP